uniref:Uncharacterized protein n=1 Tax=Steinernema glaseri TaxID=37863 RepID=A0A1I7YRD1_9BILA
MTLSNDTRNCIGLLFPNHLAYFNSARGHISISKQTLRLESHTSRDDLSGATSRDRINFDRRQTARVQTRMAQLNYVNEVLHEATSAGLKWLFAQCNLRTLTTIRLSG